MGPAKALLLTVKKEKMPHVSQDYRSVTKKSQMRQLLQTYSHRWKKTKKAEKKASKARSLRALTILASTQK